MFWFLFSVMFVLDLKMALLMLCLIIFVISLSLAYRFQKAFPFATWINVSLYENATSMNLSFSNINRGEQIMLFTHIMINACWIILSYTIVSIFPRIKTATTLYAEHKIEMLLKIVRMHLKSCVSVSCNTRKRCCELKRAEISEGRVHEEFLENEALGYSWWIMLLFSSKVWVAAVCVCVCFDWQQAGA